MSNYIRPLFRFTLWRLYRSKGFFMYKIFLIILLIPLNVFAQVREDKDTSTYRLDEVTIVGSRLTTDKYRSTSQVQILSRSTIEKFNGNTVGEILSYQPEIFIKSYGGNASLQTISADGLGAEHTSIMLNGIRLNSAQNAQYDLSLIPTDNIERIEIVNDAVSTAFGSGSTGGVINIMTTENQKKNSFTLKGSAGSYNFFRYLAGANLHSGNSAFIINFSKEKSDNNYAYHFFDGVNLLLKNRINSNYEMNNLFSSFVNNGRNYSLDANLIYTKAKRNLPGPETGNENSFAYQNDEQFNLIFTLKNILSDKMSLESSGGYRYSLQNYNDFIRPEYYKEGNYFFNTHTNYLNKNIKISAGAEMNYFNLKSDAVSDDAKRFQPSIYSLMELDFWKIVFAPSVRYEYTSDLRNSSIYGKAGLNFRPFEKENLHLRINVSNGGRVPTFNELYWETGGNRNLKSEKSFNLQAGMIYNFDLLFVNTVELSYNYVKMKDKIIWKPVNGSIYWSPINIADSRSDVLSFSYDMTKKITKNITAGLKVSYTYNKAVNTSGDYGNDGTLNKQLIYIPVEMSQSSFNLKVYNFGVNFLYTFLGKRYINEDNSLYLKGTDIFGANINCVQKIFNLDFNIKLEINNLFNSDYQVISGYPAPLRNYKLELNITY